MRKYTFWNQNLASLLLSKDLRRIVQPEICRYACVLLKVEEGCVRSQKNQSQRRGRRGLGA
ncbi:hypothetical protein R6Q59_034700 [Mikania micrantha]